MQLNHLIIL